MKSKCARRFRHWTRGGVRKSTHRIFFSRRSHVAPSIWNEPLQGETPGEDVYYDCSYRILKAELKAEQTGEVGISTVVTYLTSTD